MQKSKSQIRLVRITTVPLSFQVLLRGQLNYFSFQGMDVITLSGEEFVNELGEKAFVLPLSREIDIAKDMKSLINTFRALKEYRPQIVHTHTPKAGLVGMMAAWLARVPVRLHTVAGLPEMEANGVMKPILRTTERLTARLATTVYPNSRGLMQYMLTNKLSKPDKLNFIANGSSNGIDVEHFQCTKDIGAAACRKRENNAIATDAIVFIFIGRLDNHKGMRELREAFEQLDKEMSVHLLLVGARESAREGLDRETFQWFQAHERVHLAGFQEDVRPWLAAADVLVFPSYREGFPNVPMQAGAMELPSIVTDINGCNEIIDDEFNGLIIPPKDSGALYEAMKRMGENKELRQKLGANARPRIVARYEQKWFWKQLHKEYLFQLENAGIKHNLPQPE